jgi:hypothetical protein
MGVSQNLYANPSQNFKQVWFPGAHSDCGGGYEDTSISDLTLAWMCDQLSPFIDFNEDYIVEQVDENIQRNYATKASPDKPAWQWSLGKIHSSSTFLTSVTGFWINRTPGRYQELDYASGKPAQPAMLLRDTHEFIHPSVRARYYYGLDESNSNYKPKALDGWKMSTKKADDGSLSVAWQYDGPKGDIASGKVMPEAELGKFEKLLLSRDPEMNANLFPDS